MGGHLPLRPPNQNVGGLCPPRPSIIAAPAVLYAGQSVEAIACHPSIRLPACPVRSALLSSIQHVLICRPPPVLVVLHPSSVATARARAAGSWESPKSEQCVRVAGVAAGLAESNGSLPSGL